MQSTRAGILEYLKKYKTATALELGKALNFTAANIRHHLHILEEAGRVQVVGQRKPPAPGRPTDVYSLTSHTLGDNTTGLLLSVLKTWNQDPSAEDDRHLRLVAEQLAGNLQGDTRSPVSLLNRAVQRLNQLQYQASWEAHPTGPRLILRHCPYLDLPRDYPQLCRLDCHLLSVLLDQEMELVEKRSPRKQIPNQCLFRPRKSS